MIKATLPVLRKNLDPKVPDRDNVRRTHDKVKLNQERFYNNHEGARKLKFLSIGDKADII